MTGSMSREEATARFDNIEEGITQLFSLNRESLHMFAEHDKADAVKFVFADQTSKNLEVHIAESKERRKNRKAQWFAIWTLVLGCVIASAWGWIERHVTFGPKQTIEERRPQ